MKRHRAPSIPTDKDLSAFRALIRCANDAAKLPDQTRAAKLDRAANKAARAVMPVSQQPLHDGALNLLRKEGQTFLTKSPDERQAVAGTLATLAERAAEILKEPVRRTRADIDG